MHVLSNYIKTADWEGGLLWLVFALAAIAGTVLSLGKKKPPAIEKIHLRDLSALWTKEGTKTIHISELSPLWRDDQFMALEEESPTLAQSSGSGVYEEYPAVALV